MLSRAFGCTLPGLEIERILADRWDAIRKAFEGDEEKWTEFSTKLLALLRQLDEGKDRAATLSEIERLFDASPAAGQITFPAASAPPPPKSSGGLKSPWATDVKSPRPAPRPPGPRPAPSAGEESSSGGSYRGISPAPAPAPAPARAQSAPPPAPSRHVQISVLYGTDREPHQAENGFAQYGDEGVESLAFGVANVSIPDRTRHIKGRLERPRWYRLEFRENVDKHVVILELDALDEAAFIQRAQAGRKADGSDDEALIFVHGYKVSFEDSIRRTAQFAHDLEFKGQAIAYSWPSKARLTGFSKDANASDWSMFRLADFIHLVRTKLGLKRLHIVAHSMGNRLLTRALNQHVLVSAKESAKTRKAWATLNQMVFAAPDIDPKTFGGFAEVFAEACKRCTLYTSQGDWALKASALLYGGDRAGADAAAVVKYGIDAIDASTIDNSMLGHSYFSDHRLLLQDLSDLLINERAPGDRYGLTEIPAGSGRYWQFDA